MVLSVDAGRTFRIAGSEAWNGAWEKETSSEITKAFPERGASWDEH